MSFMKGETEQNVFAQVIYSDFNFQTCSFMLFVAPTKMLIRP